MRWLATLAILITALAGCTSEPTDDAGNDAGGESAPDHPLPDVITGMEYVATGHENGTSGLWLHDDKAYLSGGSGLRIIDVSDPANPVTLAGDIADTDGTRDVDVMEHPDGRTYAFLAHGGAKMTVVDVTEPELATVVSTVTNIGASHNLAVVPNSTIVYNSISINTGAVEALRDGIVPGGAGWIDIVDFADVQDPQVKQFIFPNVIQTPAGAPKPVAATTCHDITFHAQRGLGYCAGVTETHIWDVGDPWNPRIIQVIDWPAVNIHHGVWATLDGDMLVLGDEIAGVAAPVPGCGNDVPTSALWFFDVSDIETPLPAGYYQVSHDAVAASAEAGEAQYCSTHFGTLVEDRPMMVMGHYTAGTALIDFSDPANAAEVDLYTPSGTNTWEARYYNGHVYTGDTARGMEILRLI